MADCKSLATFEHVVDWSGAEPSCRAYENGQLQASVKSGILDSG